MFIAAIDPASLIGSLSWGIFFLWLLLAASRSWRRMRQGHALLALWILLRGR